MTEIIATQVIQDFAIIMVVASVMALISYRLKHPMVIGYIVAGIIISVRKHRLLVSYSILKF